MKRIISALIASAMLAAAFCGVSGAEDVRTNVHCGDVNGDGRVTLKDVSTVMKHLAGAEISLDLSAADADTSGEINAKDVAFMLRYVTGWHVLLSPDGLEEFTGRMKKSVLESTSEYEFAEVGKKNHIYYVSSSEGDDGNDGLSPDEPLETLETVEYLKLKMGDVILFKRGDEFRGKLPLKTGITYSSYGEGAKPILNGSEMNYADESLWVETEYENIYKCKERLNNVGNIVFDFSGVIGSYDEKLGRQILKRNGSQTVTELITADLDFYSDLDTNELYLYSTEGNPGTRFGDIEICTDGAIMPGSEAGVTVDNLCFMFGGGHGVGCGDSKNLTVKNCVFCWIGGSVLKGFSGGNTTRYGNAVEIFGAADGYYVCNNWMYQICDTGVTHQYSATEREVVMRNIEYADNLIEYCHWGIEYYNTGCGSSSMENVRIHDNLVKYTGLGWRDVGGSAYGGAICGSSMPAIIKDYVVENNVIAYSAANMIIHNEARSAISEQVTFKNNTYIQNYGGPLASTSWGSSVFDENAAAFLTGTMREENPRVFFAEAK